jgi:hypothetical protein
MFIVTYNYLQCDYDEMVSLKQDSVPGIAVPTLRDFIHHYDRLHPAAAMYVFQNVFYTTEAESAHNATGQIRSLQKVWHLESSGLAGRMKTIYKVHRMDHLYTHGGVVANSNFTQVNVNLTVGSVKHYRTGLGRNIVNVGVDYSVLDIYTNLLVNNRFYQYLVKLNRSDTGFGVHQQHHKHSLYNLSNSTHM